MNASELTESSTRMHICRTPMELAQELINWWKAQPHVFDQDATPVPKGLVIAKDFRDQQRPSKSRARIVKLRPASSIVGITLHQTATRDFAPTHPGLDDVPAHAMVHRDGSVSLLHHPSAYLYHGHALNAGTIGIEIACRAAGTEGDASTFWRSKKERLGWHEEVDDLRGHWPEHIGPKKDHPGRWHPNKLYPELVAEATDAQLAATRALVRYYIELVPTVRALWAHKQGRKDRTSDPGSRIYRAVAEPLRTELNLVDVRDLVVGDGTPIPKEWRT